MTRIPGTVWKCEHCGGLREDDGKCKFCGALEQPHLPPDRLREPLGIPTGRGYGMIVVGGQLERKQQMFSVLASKTICAERALLVMSGGPFVLRQMTIGNRLQWSRDAPLHTDVVQQIGFVELEGDCTVPGVAIDLLVEACHPVGIGCEPRELFLYVRGPCVEQLPSRLPQLAPLLPLLAKKLSR